MEFQLFVWLFWFPIQLGASLGQRWFGVLPLSSSSFYDYATIWFHFFWVDRGTCCPAPLFYFQILSLRIFFFFFIFWFLNLKRIRKEWSATAVWCGSNRLALLYMAWLCVTVPTTRPWLPLPACLPAFISINNHLLFREESLLFPFLFLKSSVLRVLQENTRREI